jgi:formate hydrogenlyase transcriptional activator
MPDRLIADISTVLSRAAHDELDDLLAPMLQRVVGATGLARATLVEYDDEGRVLRVYGPDRAWGDDLAQPGATGVALVDDLAPDDVWTVAAVKVTISGAHTCALIIEAADARCWGDPLATQLRLFAEIVAARLHRRAQDQALRAMRDDVTRLTAQLGRASDPFDVDEAAPPPFDEIIGNSAALRAALSRLQEVAPTDSTVLLLGDTGTGKELFARALHARGPRRAKPLVVVNCAALPPTLIESELFGHTRGAFTGATEARQGRFELAHGGTLFLDEIGDLPIDLQTKLLRVLQEGTFERLGSSQVHKVDVRIIAATHRDLSAAAADGSFRSDLFYRLNVFPIRVPPLRERASDIPELVWYIVHKRQRTMHRSIKRIPDAVMSGLQRYHWPGNVRELENVLERALIHSTGDTLRLLDEPFGAPASAEPSGTLTAVERMHINEVLHACGWRINGDGNAAERLGMHPNTLRFRMKKLGIVRGHQPTQRGAESAAR